MKKVAITVPIYKPFLTKYEEISYKQLFKVLGKYDVYFIIPRGLKLQFDIFNASCAIFDSEFFLSTETYSQLLLTKDFYYRFFDYEYILIYQLDALVFEDKLVEFCEMGFDYIGAPWLSGFSDYLRNGMKVLHVGNGGLSLRNIRHCLQALEENKDLLREYSGRNEDAFFSSCDSNIFKVAPMEIAIRFSFEREVKRCFDLNGKKLPFGCHAWEKYNRTFWITVLEKLGYDLSFADEVGGNEDANLTLEYLWLERNSLIFENEGILLDLVYKLKEILAEYSAQGFYLWGAGYFGRSIQKLLYDFKVPVIGFIDNNPLLNGKIIQGIPVCSANLPDDAVVIVVTTEKYYSSIETDLKQLNYIKNRDYYMWKDFLPEVNYVSSKGDNYYSCL